MGDRKRLLTRQPEILAVDDTPESLRLLTRILSECGYRVRPASSGRLALRSVEAKPPDLIMLDVKLPDMDGFEVCRCLKSSTVSRPIPVIFISALGETANKVKGFAVGAVDYVTKPFEAEEVVARVRTQLRLRELTEHLEQKVEERTAELTSANKHLEEEMAERLRAEQYLRRSEAKFRCLVETSQDLIWSVDSEGLFTYLNDTATRRIYGYAASEMLGRPFTDFMLPEQAAKDLRVFEDIKNGKASLEYETVHCRKDGTQIDMRFCAVVLRDEQGSVLGTTGTASDITGRKVAEQERSAHMKFLERMDRINRTIQEASDVESMLAEVLDVILDELGCDRVSLMYPGDPESRTWSIPMERTKPAYPGALASGELPMDEDVATSVRLLLEADGPLTFGPGGNHPMPLDVSQQFGFKSFMAMALYPKIGKPWVFGVHQCSHDRVWTPEEVTLFREIGRRLSDGLTSQLAHHDLQESQRRLAEAQRIAHIGHWDRDLIGGRATLSDEACRIFAVPITESSMELSEWQDKWLSLIHVEDRKAAAAAFDSALSGEDSFDIEYRLVRPDRVLVHLHSRGVVTKDELGQVTRIFGTVLDVTASKLAEEALRLANDQLNEDKQLLRDKNIALRELMTQAREQKDDLGRQMAVNVERVLLPMLDRMELQCSPQGKEYAGSLRENLVEIASPFYSRLASLYASLTPRETEICDLVRRGMSSKAIASALSVSVNTVFNQRRRIRQKLKIADKETNLVTFLRTLDDV